MDDILHSTKYQVMLITSGTEAPDLENKIKGIINKCITLEGKS